VNPNHLPDADALAAAGSRVCKSGYCDAFADHLFDASSASRKRILRVATADGADVLTHQGGGIGRFAFHDVFTDGKYVFDPLLHGSPIPLGDWKSYMKKLNPSASIMVRPRNAPWNFGFRAR
jgi:filamentous hemagglutinin